MAAGPRAPLQGEIREPTECKLSEAGVSRKVEDSRLFTAAVRSGHASELPTLLDEAAAWRPNGTAEQRLSDILACLRMCVTAGNFKEGLVAYEHVAARLETDCGHLWSILLYCAVMVGDFNRCQHFMEKVWEKGETSSKDVINMSRYFAQRGDGQGMVDLLRRFREAGQEVDVLTRNRILSICANCRRGEMADAVVAETCDTPMDIIGYHALIKGHSQSGNLDRCFAHYHQLCKTRKPTSITFGLLLDACVDTGSVEGARKIFADLQNSPGVINVVHYTTFIRCLTSAGEMKEAVQVFEQMLDTPGVQADTGSWFSLVKALADTGHVDEAMQVLARVRGAGFERNQISFNVVLNGCAVKLLPPHKVLNIFEQLLVYGLKPTTSTLSVMVKALGRSESWSDAEALVGSAQSRFGFVPGKRVFAQLKRAKRTSWTSTQSYPHMSGQVWRLRVWCGVHCKFGCQGGIGSCGLLQFQMVALTELNVADEALRNSVGKSKAVPADSISNADYD